MATLTTAPELSIVNVILTVTGIAACHEADTAFDRFSVTGMAVDALMSSIQAETGSGVVIKFPQCPGVRVVAGLTLRTESLPVCVIVLVTTIAIAGRIGEHCGQVTFLAGSNCMQSD